MRRSTYSALAAATMMAGSLALPASTAHAQSVPTSGMDMYGITHAGELVRYDFDKQKASDIGPVKTDAGQTLTNIDASAYIPGFQNLYAFWTGTVGGVPVTRLVYVNAQTGRASFVGQNLDSGKVTGAVAALTTGDESWMTNLTAQKAVSGVININPNNSPDNEFTLTAADGSIITRDDLKHANVQADGTCFAGTATNIRIKPKGNANDNTFALAGTAYPLQNGTTYLFTGAMQVNLYNDHVQNGKAMGHWYIEFTGGDAMVQDGSTPTNTASHVNKWAVFALQDLSTGDNNVPFTINDDEVKPDEAYYAKVTVLGSAITYGAGGYDVPVTTRIIIGGQAYDEFGSYGSVDTGNVNDHKNPRNHVFPDQFAAGTPVTVMAQSWLRHGHRGHYYYSQYLEANSASGNSQQLVVLKNGDQAPHIAGFGGQNDVSDYLRDYVNPLTGQIVLDQNQAIFLFELGSTNVTSPAADFQDVVVLLTLAKNKDQIDDPNGGSDGGAGAKSRLILVDHATGGFKQIMTLNNIYDGLAWSSQKVFYATKGVELWKVDPMAQTETLMGSMSKDHMLGLEFLGDSLTGFETVSNALHGLDAASGAMGTPMISSGTINDLGTMVYVPAPKDPANLPDAYD